MVYINKMVDIIQFGLVIHHTNLMNDVDIGKLYLIIYYWDILSTIKTYKRLNDEDVRMNLI